MTDIRDALMVGRSSDGRLVRRPISPHLQIYRLPMTAKLSISHRISGVALAAGTLLLVWFLVAAATSDAAYATVSSFLRSPVGYLMLFGWTAALWYHFCAGVRHLFWDAGNGFTLPTVRVTDKLVPGAALALTILTWLIVLLAA